jgi:uncharacterized protein
MQTTTEHPNATKFRAAMEAFNRGDLQPFGELLADDVEWHQIGAETLHGRQAMIDSMPAQGEVDWTITGDIHDVVANDEHLVALVNAKAARADGRTLDYRTVEILHVRDGKVTERWAFSDDTQRIADFFK